ncbi:MAG TPA: hypothetical protein VG963_02190 [Polyangiaceae bacterium]|nr:hypothetical protein [Polyangiaceae bacterium]
MAFPPDETQSDPAAIPHFDDPLRIEESVFSAGDLDGDGADDLFGTSEHYILDESGSPSARSNPELHIYYGTPASAAPGNDVH